MNQIVVLHGIKCHTHMDSQRLREGTGSQQAVKVLSRKRCKNVVSTHGYDMV